MRVRATSATMNIRIIGLELVRVHNACGLCGKRIGVEEKVASLHVVLRSGRGESVELPAECLRPHLNREIVGGMVDEAATVRERQQIWDEALRPGLG